MAGVFVSVLGLKLMPEEVDLLRSSRVMGIVLFKENYESPEQLKALITSMREVRPDLIITVDQEGGQIQRFFEEKLPSLHSFGMAWDEAKSEEEKTTVLKTVSQAAYDNAMSLLDVGVDLLLGPVVDLHDPQSPVIGGKARAFHENPEVVMTLAAAYLDGLEAAGMVRGVIKHFPGHGCIKNFDSHTDAIIFAGEVPELPIFKDLMQKARPFGVMLAHVIYPAIDPDNVVGTSPVFYQIIREEIGYKGFILSDCLSMKGAHGLCAAELEEITGAEDLVPVFKVCIAKLLRSFAPFHNGLILTHLSTLWDTLFPDHEGKGPVGGTMVELLTDALKSADFPPISAEEKAFVGEIRRRQPKGEEQPKEVLKAQ